MDNEELYECARCSRLPGAATLCADCFNRRRIAGSKWRGPRPVLPRGNTPSTTPDPGVPGWDRPPATAADKALQRLCNAGSAQDMGGGSAEDAKRPQPPAGGGGVFDEILRACEAIEDAAYDGHGPNDSEGKGARRCIDAIIAIRARRQAVID